MTTLIYDNTFPGFLTAVFQVYEYRFTDVIILPQSSSQHSLFGDNKMVETNDAQAARVWRGLAKHVPPKAVQQVYYTFLSELPRMENLLLQYIQYVLARPGAWEDQSHAAVLFVSETARKVHREKHRMEAFVRFRQAADDLYHAVVEPDHNVLPLIADHFEKRYADQKWLIYDKRRKYGIYYDMHTLATVDIDFEDILLQRSNTTGVLHDDENEYEKLWQNYFKSVNIASRKNIKLHRQHMPLRYWKYLTEKQG